MKKSATVSWACSRPDKSESIPVFVPELIPSAAKGNFCVCRSWFCKGRESLFPGRGHKNTLEKTYGAVIHLAAFLWPEGRHGARTLP